jgi:hypothetical protein
MEELILNLHIHSTYSDGSATHKQIAQAGLNAGVDVLFVTDHNVLVSGVDAYYNRGDQKLLMLAGEEIHDKTREPQKNHLLAFGHTRELCTYAEEPQNLINQVRKNNGLSFLAHPFEDALEMADEVDISWVDWEVRNFDGLEIWNHLSELKTVSSNWFELLFYIFVPQAIAHHPPRATLQKWDELLIRGEKMVAIGGSDSHALKMQKGPLKRTVFPYEFHFRCINNHLIVPNGLSGDLLNDRKMILEALRRGHSFVGYDLPAATRGFRFYAQGNNEQAEMGDEILLENSITLQIRLPETATCRLICNGAVLKTWEDQEICMYTTKEAGVYRVECDIDYLGKKRSWIFSNPIYIRQKN